VFCFCLISALCIALCYLLLVFVIAPSLCFVGSGCFLLVAFCWWLLSPCCALLVVVGTHVVRSISALHCPYATLCYVMLEFVGISIMCFVGVC